MLMGCHLHWAPQVWQSKGIPITFSSWETMKSSRIQRESILFSSIFREEQEMSLRGNNSGGMSVPSVASSNYLV